MWSKGWVILLQIKTFWAIIFLTFVEFLGAFDHAIVDKISQVSTVKWIKYSESKKNHKGQILL